MPTFEKNKGFNLKNKGNFDFGNKGNFDFYKGEGSIGDAINPYDTGERKTTPKYKKEVPVKNYKKGYYGA